MQPPSAQFVSAKERSLAKEDEFFDEAVELPDDLPPPGVCSVCWVDSDELEMCLRSGSRRPVLPSGLPWPGARLICGALVCPMCWEVHQEEPHVDHGDYTAAAS